MEGIVIRNVPVPFPDETSYSLLARYFQRMRFPPWTIESYLYTRKYNRFIYAYLPNHVRAFIDNLPPGHPLSYDELIFSHTLFPYIGIFIDNDDFMQVKNHMMTDGNYGYIRKYISSLKLPSRFKYCPICMKEDIMQFGEAYWHRIHQCPGVFICHRHAVWLENSEIDLLANPTNSLYTAENNIRKSKPRLIENLNPKAREYLISITKDIEWILCNKNNCEPLSVYKRIQCCLYEQGFISTSGIVNTKELLLRTRSYLWEVFQIHDFNLSYQANRMINLLTRPQTYGTMHHKPFEILQVINLLGFSLKDFIQKKDGYDYNKPYPCINTSCKNYHNQNINESHIIREGKFGNRYSAIVTCPYCKNKYKLEDDNSFYHTGLSTVKEYIEIRIMNRKLSSKRNHYHNLVVPRYSKNNENNNSNKLLEIVKYIRKMNNINKLRNLALNNYIDEHTKRERGDKVKFNIMLYYGIPYREIYDVLESHYFSRKKYSFHDILDQPLSQKAIKKIIRKKKTLDGIISTKTS